jgi:hypothetical protein
MQVFLGMKEKGRSSMSPDKIKQRFKLVKMHVKRI